MLATGHGMLYGRNCANPGEVVVELPRTTRTWRCRRKRMNVTLQFDRCGRSAWSRESSVKSCLGTGRRQRSRQRTLYSTSCVFCVRSERHCCCSLLTLISCLAKTVCDCVSGPSNCRSGPFASSSLGDRQACHHTCELQFSGERCLSGHSETSTPILVSEPWTRRVRWERTLSPKTTKVAPAALGRCINSHQSDLNSLKRVAGETTSSTKSEHREKQRKRPLYFHSATV